MSESRVGSRLHGCLRGFPAAALELSADGYVMDSNGRLEALLGQGVVNRPFAELLDTTSRAKWARLLAGRDRGDAPAGELWEFVLEGRSALELRTFAAVWGHDGNEAVLWLIEYSRDLRLEPLYEELSAANAELVQAQRELAKERTRLARAHALEAEARATAERAVRLRDEVLAVVAHDLRNPLSRISTTAALLADASLPSESRQQLLGVLQRSAGAMDRLVRDLLDVASIEAGRLAVERRPLDVAALVADVCALFGPAAAERGVRLDCQATEDTPAVAADHDRLLQALGNLLDNALRLTPAGGRIVVRAGGVGEAARLSVSDTGPGIGPEELPHLFDRFWQDLRSRRGSAGLGLAIAKGIVEAHEGRLWAESTPGQGSTFVILLPGRPASAGTSGE